MALKDSRGGREYDKFVADASGDTAMRVSTTSSTTTEATSSGASTIAGAWNSTSSSIIAVKATPLPNN